MLATGREVNGHPRAAAWAILSQARSEADIAKVMGVRKLPCRPVFHVGAIDGKYVWLLKENGAGGFSG